MISKEEFRSIPELAKELRNDRNRIEVMRSKLYSPRGLDTSDKVQSSGSQTALADIVIDMEQKADAKEKELDVLKMWALQAIYKTELTVPERAVMVLRYTEDKKWDEIVDAVYYGRASVFRIHDNALEKIFKDETT